MNRRAQFFILSTIVMAVALTTILGLLTVPVQLTMSNLLSQTRNIHEFQELFNNFNSITGSLYDEWPVSQQFRTSFSVYNYYALSAQNNDFVVKVEVDEYAEPGSFQLMRSGEYVPASFAYTGSGNLIVSFKDSISAGTKKDYSVFYNVLSDESKALVEEKASSNYYEDASQIIYYSPTYSVSISKSSGVITNLFIKGDANDLVNSFGARVRTSLDYEQSAMSATVSITNYTNNLLLINASGFIEPSTYLTQHYYLTPDFILVRQDFIISASGNYNLSYNADANTYLTSLAYNNYANLSLNMPSEGLFSSDNYYSVFNDTIGIIFLYSQDSLSSAVTGFGVDTRLQLLENSYEPNVVTQEIIIKPYYNNYNNSLICGKAFASNPASEITILKNDYLTYLSKPIISSTSGSLTNLVFSLYNNETFNPQVIAAKNNNPSFVPHEFTAPSVKGNDLNTIILSNKEKTVMPYGLTTKNYHNSSSADFYLKNNASAGVSSSDYELINLYGTDFLISVIMNSKLVTNTLAAKVYSPNNTLVLSQVLTPLSPGSFEQKDLTVNGFNASGIYTLNLEGDNVTFKVLTSLPLISAKAPLIVNNTNPAVLYFEADDDFSLQAAGLESSSANITLNNTRGLIFQQAAPFSRNINHTYYSRTPYNLYLSPGVTLLNTTLNFGDENYYLSDNYELNYVTFNPVLGKNYYYLNSTLSSVNSTIFASNMTYSYASNTLVNSLYSWDFDSEVFTYKGSNNWLYSGDFYACTGTYGSCTAETTSFTFDYLIENTTLFKSARFSSNTINVVLRAYNSSNLFRIDLFNPTSLAYTFGINIRINGDDDSYYKASFEDDESALSSGEHNYYSYEIESSGWNYIGKRDASAYAILAFDSSDLLQGRNSMIVSDDYLRVGLNAYGKKTIYYYIAEDWSSADALISSLNNYPNFYPEPIQYYVEYDSEAVKGNAYLIG